MAKRPAYQPDTLGSLGTGTGLLALILYGGMLIIVGSVSADALIVVLRDGLVALAILFAATGLGLWIVRAVGVHGVERRWQVLCAVSLGTGALSLLVLLLGTLGILHRFIWISLLCLAAGIGLFRLPALLRSPHDAEADDYSPTIRWLWLIAIGFGAFALLGGTMPPGILWPPEGNGYDVLEYHLGGPRDYFDSGVISYLPHNIYSNFPFNVEMLYLLSMVLHGDPIAAVFTAKILNVFLAMLAIAAVWLAGRESGPRTGIVAGLLAATCPFLVYLSGVAYVENGMIFYAAMSLAAALRAARAPDRPGRWWLVTGLFSGFACGCKYTAVPAVAIPLAAFAAFASIRRRGRPLKSIAAFGLGCSIAFGPWLIKNTISTGNPVFPLGYGVLGAAEGVWDADGVSRWHEGHLPAPEHRSFAGRLSRLWHEVLASSLFGPVIGLAIAAILIHVVRRLSKRGAGATPDDLDVIACLIMIVIPTAIWLGFTHLVGRFAIVLLVPAAVLSARVWASIRSPFLRRLGLPLLVAIAAFNFYTVWRLFNETSVPYVKYNFFGKTELMMEGDFPGAGHIPVLNRLRDGGILSVGDARRFYLSPTVDCCVVFNRNPFAEAAANKTPAELLNWLRRRGYSHVYVDWSEIRRLSASRYGFWASIDPGLFERLAEEGLRSVRHFTFGDGQTGYATLFELPKLGEAVTTAPARSPASKSRTPPTPSSPPQ